MSALPRVLDIRAFVESRSTEVATLLSGIQEVHGKDKLGYAALPRHLRRRATSHHRRVRPRRPNIRLARQYGSSSKKARLELPHGGTADVTTRPVNRAMRRRPHRRWLANIQHQCYDLQMPSPQKTPADEPREANQEQVPHVSLDPGSASASAADVAQSEAFTVSTTAAAAAATVRRLETHDWHARRMCMHGPLWGHNLALHAQGGGKGSRSLLHHVRTSCCIHDASYHGCIQLSGHQKHLAAILEACSNPGHVQQQLDRAEVICGAAEWEFIVHHPHRHPQGAICPARAMFIPTNTENMNQTQTDGNTTLKLAQPVLDTVMTGVADSGHDSSGDIQNVEDGWYEKCMLWLWIHPSAFREAATALTAAIQAQSMQDSVAVSNLSTALQRLELVGPGSDDVLHSILQLTSEQHDESDRRTSHKLWTSLTEARSATNTTQPGNSQASQLHFKWPDGCAIGLSVLDPRLAQPVRLGKQQINARTGSAKVDGSVANDQLGAMSRHWPDSGDWTDGASELLTACATAVMNTQQQHNLSQKQQQHSAQSQSRFVWKFPMMDAEVSTQRKQARLQALYMGSALQTKVSTAPSYCNVLLVRRQYGGLPGWSVIVPAGWVKPLWMACIFKGSRACGIQDMRWIAAQTSQAAFPFDYPHTEAFTSTMNHVKAVEDAAAARRPPGRRRQPSNCLPYLDWSMLGEHVDGRKGGMSTAAPTLTGWTSAKQEKGTHHKPDKRHAHQQGNNFGGEHSTAQPSGLCTAMNNACIIPPSSLRQLVQYSAGGQDDSMDCERDLTSHASGQSLISNPERKFVRVQVRLLGKGTCQDGAVILSKQNSAVDSTRCRILGYVTSACPVGVKAQSQGCPWPAYPGGAGVVSASLLAELCSHDGRRFIEELQVLVQDIARKDSLPRPAILRLLRWTG